MGLGTSDKSQIKIGFLISYDYKMLPASLRLVYEYADEIILAIDVNRRSWAGTRYAFDEDFLETVKKNDPDHKIVIFEEDFYLPSLSPIANETRERNMISEKMGPDCWKLQIDVDEYFVDFKSVYHFLQEHRYLLSKPQYNQVNIRAKWVTLFKKTEHGFLYIDNDEDFSFATNLVGAHFFARDLASLTNREIHTNFRVIHQSWAREPEEIYQKINNWGHKNDFDTERYFKFWKQVDENNYTEFTDLHPVYPKDWKNLKFIACSDVQDFCQKFHELHPAEPVIQLPLRFFKKYIKNRLKFWR